MLRQMKELSDILRERRGRRGSIDFDFSETKIVLDETGMIVEGAAATKSISELAERIGVDLPITRTVNDVLYGGKSVEDAIEGLLGRSPDTEFYGIADIVDETDGAGDGGDCCGAMRSIA